MTTFLEGRTLSSQSGNIVRQMTVNGTEAVHKTYIKTGAFERERFALHLLNSTPLRVPSVIQEGSGSIGPYLDITWINGDTLEHISGDLLETAAFQVGVAIGHLSSIQASSWIDSPLRYRQETFPAILERTSSQVSKSVISRIQWCFDAKEHSFNHRDVRFANSIWLNQDQQIALIDFETCCWGPCGADLGRMLLEDFNKPMLSRKVLEGYKSVSDKVPDVDGVKLLYAIEMFDYLSRLSAPSDAEKARARDLLLLLHSSGE